MLPLVLTLKLTQQASCSLSLSVLRNMLGTGAIMPSKVCAIEKFGQAEIFGLGSGHNGMDPALSIM
jgi:hypothetical protein